MGSGSVSVDARARHAGPRRPRAHLRSAGEAVRRIGRRGARAVRQLHRDGAEPAQILADLAEAVHITTRAKTLGAAGRRRRTAGARRGGARRRSASGCRWRSCRAPGRCCSRAWRRCADAPNPAAAAEMVLIRLAYTADLPPPDEIIKALGGGSVGVRPAGSGRTGAGAPAQRRRCTRRRQRRRMTTRSASTSDEERRSTRRPPSLPVVRSFADVVALAGERREAKLKVHLEEHVSLVKFDAGGQHRAASAARRAQGACQRAAREAQRLDRQALDGGAEQRAAASCRSARWSASARRPRSARHRRSIRRWRPCCKQFPDAEITGVRPLPERSDDRPARADSSAERGDESQQRSRHERPDEDDEAGPGDPGPHAADAGGPGAPRGGGPVRRRPGQGQAERQDGGARR